MRSRIFNCPASQPFPETLAQSILSGRVLGQTELTQEQLLSLVIYVPSISNVLPLKLAFLKLAPNKATLLPRILVLGETDPLDMMAAFAPGMKTQKALALLSRGLSIPDPVSRLKRQLSFAAFVHTTQSSFENERKQAEQHAFEPISSLTAFKMGGALASLVAECHAEHISPTALAALQKSGSEVQRAPRLLYEAVSSWLSYQTKTNAIDPEDRRNRLMQIEADFIESSSIPVIVAGSTGSLASTRHLMRAVLTKANGAVVLNGLDRNLDAESWDLIGHHPEHSQHNLWLLLHKLKCQREAVQDLKSQSFEHEKKSVFLSEVMRPAASTGKWNTYLDELRQHRTEAPPISLLEAENTQTEAETIAIIVREALEHPEVTLCVVSPDDQLLTRVRHQLQRWDVPFETEANTSNLAFAQAVVTCAASGTPEQILALLRHHQAATPYAKRLTYLLDLGSLRQTWRPYNWSTFLTSISRTILAASKDEINHASLRHITEHEWSETLRFCKSLLSILEAFQSNESQKEFVHWIDLHRIATEDIHALLANESGEAQSRLNLVDIKQTFEIFDELQRAAPAKFKLALSEYANLFRAAIGQTEWQSHLSLHPRLSLCKPIEARLKWADTMILSGLNEGCWPQNPGHDGWVSKNDRAFLGLPPQERRVGQSAYDFTSLSGACNRVILTRSKTMNGKLARPSRWVARLKTVAQGANWSNALLHNRPWQEWAHTLRKPELVTPAAKPEPRPPLSSRPRRLSVTAIETWFANPYAIYARHILKLDSLRLWNDSLGPRDKGLVLHAAMHRFMEKYPKRLPKNAVLVLCNEFETAALDFGIEIARVPFWRPRFERFALWFLEWETSQRADLLASRTEVFGKLSVPGALADFTVTARADRIDLTSSKALRIFDFKTSLSAAHNSLKRNAPQLALEGLLARSGAFDLVQVSQNLDLAYIVATGGDPAGDVKYLKAPSVSEAIDNARDGLIKQIASFDDPQTAYGYTRRAIFSDKNEHDPYAHLARVKEWSHLEESADEDE